MDWMDDMQKQMDKNELWKNPPCLGRDHEFPSHLYIPAGQTYRHQCPSCGQVTTVTPPTLMW